MKTLYTTTLLPPQILTKFNPFLLSLPIFRYDASYFLKIAEFIQKKIYSSEFHKYPSTIVKLKQKHQKFMEIYERAKTEEGKNEKKAFVKAKMPFYRPRYTNFNDQRLFERLDNRRKTSALMLRKNNAV